MGLSGSGKSTLVRCMTRLIEPTAGEVMLDGEDIVKATRTRSGSSADAGSAWSSSISAAAASAGDGRLVRPRDPWRTEGGPRGAVRAMIDLVGLQGHADSYPDQLSGGMQQRVGLARALAVDPEVMFFDELFSALYPSSGATCRTRSCDSIRGRQDHGVDDPRPRRGAQARRSHRHHA